MALNIDLDGFGFLESDSDASKLSPALKQPPISPIESESSSGISSLDSDDLKKQLLASPPTISQDHDDDDEAEQSDSGSSTTSSGSSSSTSVDSDAKKDSDIDVDGEILSDSSEAAEEKNEMPKMPIITQVMYENRNILNLGNNVWNSGRFIQFTVLPENNVNCFFQNRAQYWRLANNNCNAAHDAMEKCSCCDFSYPPQLFGQFGNGNAAEKNSITDSLMTFLKNNLVDYQNPVMSSNINTNANPSMPMYGGNVNPNNNRRMYNNNASYAAYQMMQQQQYQNNQNSGYYGGGQMNNGGGYNGTALALLNLMNASRNVNSAGAAFQATLNNSTRYYNNNMNTNSNNGFGLYKQF